MKRSLSHMLPPLVATSRRPEQVNPTRGHPLDITERLAAARPRLTRLARLRGASADQAEDLAQETLITAWRTLDHLRDPDRFDAWLDGTLRNLCRRHTLTLAGEAIVLSDLDDGFDAAAEVGDPLDELTHQELSALIDAALGHLHASVRRALELRYLAELPPAEVAVRLGLTLNTLDVRLSRARRQLRDVLSGPLRARAIEFGLALAPADEAGWRDSRIWCHFCGHAQMRGILEGATDGGGRLVLRCPRCFEACGATETDIASSAAIKGLSSFRCATNRLMRIGVDCIARSLLREGPCYICGTPLRARVVHGDQIAALHTLVAAYPDHYYIVSDCATCGLHIKGAVAVAGWDDADIMRFAGEHQRFIIEPETLTRYDSAPTIRFSLYDPAHNERIIFFADPDTLDLRGVHLA